MSALFPVFIILDLAITYYLFRQAFVVRSNMSSKYKRRFALMLAVLAGSATLLQAGNRSAALMVAGLPACLAGLFAAGMAVAMFRHKGPWH